MGQSNIVVKDGPKADPRNMNTVQGLFRRGCGEFPESFVKRIQTDMQTLGYELEEIGLMVPLEIQHNPRYHYCEPSILYVKETVLPGLTQQWQMSQGMFGALAVIIHLAYATLAEQPSLIIIDDIGEGLDFDAPANSSTYCDNACMSPKFSC